MGTSVWDTYALAVAETRYNPVTGGV